MLNAVQRMPVTIRFISESVLRPKSNLMMPQLRQAQTVMNLLMTCQIIKENINKGKLRETATESGPCEHRRYEKPQAGLQHLTLCGLA
jgi:hypothetical protein